jgi:ribosome-interacting GTPase 1
MTVVIDKSNLKNTSKILKEKLKKSQKNGNLNQHFGKLKRKLDGLSYQLSVRENED